MTTHGPATDRPSDERGNEDALRRARRRALRAAQVVTLGLALAGCSRSHATQAEDAGREDGGAVAVISDAGGAPDAGPLAVDAGQDAGDPVASTDAGVCAVDEDWSDCCDRLEWPCDPENSWGCCAWGPYAPPGDALPESRVQAAQALLGAALAARETDVVVARA